MKTFISMLRDNSGASAAEYALILAIVGTALAVASVYLGNVIGNAVGKTANCIATTTSASCS